MKCLVNTICFIDKEMYGFGENDKAFLIIEKLKSNNWT